MNKDKIWLEYTFMVEFVHFLDIKDKDLHNSLKTLKKVELNIYLNFK